MKKTLLSSAITLCTFSMAAHAADNLQSFWAESTLNLKLRTALIQMNPNDVSIDTQYDAGTAAELVLASGDTTFGTDRITVATVLGSNPAFLAGATAAINEGLETQVKNQGKLDQLGTAAWLHFESGYFYDFVGLDLGFQGALKHSKEDQSSKLIIASQKDEGYSRLSSARVKLRYGSENIFGKAYYGRYSDADETDYLMDESEEGYGVSGHYNDITLSYDVISASAGNTEGDLQDRDTDEQNITLAYGSDFGKANITREMTEDVVTNDSISVTSGLPLSFLGLPVSAENTSDYLLIAQIDYATESQEALPDAELNQYEIMLATKLGGVTLAASYNQAGKDGGAEVANIIDKALINDYDLPGQTTLSYAVSVDGAMIKVPGLSVSAVYFDSKNIDMTAVPLAYRLTGDDSFSEVLVDTKYSFQEGSFLHGLMLRAIVGTETNQANLSGYGLYVEYNRSF
jgi:hypothetical protein